MEKHPARLHGTIRTPRSADDTSVSAPLATYYIPVSRTRKTRGGSTHDEKGNTTRSYMQLTPLILLASIFRNIFFRSQNAATERARPAAHRNQ